ncbi:MAG: diaminopimelate decarboxylase [Lachnospiraceae bacterium]|nr:diaminopimelate decarboxylase [Lachnospiraceae bacterium]
MRQREIEAVLQEYSTPAYVFDLDALQQRVGRISACLKRENIDLCYAMKANPFLIGAMEPLVERFEVCSPGEFRICERNSLPMERLVISGVSKEQKDILRMIETYQGKGIFTIESEQQKELLAECARRTGLQVKALVRITSGNQFGVDRELVKSMFAEQQKDKELSLIGIQYYSGTQKKKLSVIEKELQELDVLCREIKTELKTELSELEYGPGFFTPYFQSEPEEHLEEMLEEFLGFIRNMEFSGKITLEMGRFLTADCGTFLTSIVDRKENSGQIYGILDGGIHHLNYFGQTMAMKLPYVQHISLEEREERTEEKWNLCGSLCTAADVIVKQFPLNGAQIGDVLAFERVGAYSVTEGINLFLSRDLPAVLFYSKESGVHLVRAGQATDTINSGQIK